MMDKEPVARLLLEAGADRSRRGERQMAAIARARRLAVKTACKWRWNAVCQSRSPATCGNAITECSAQEEPARATADQVRSAGRRCAALLSTRATWSRANATECRMVPISWVLRSSD